MILYKVLNSLGINSIEFGDDAGSDEPMFESEPHFLAIVEDELIQIIEYKLEWLWVALINLDNLAYAASIEGFVFDVTEVAKNFLYFLLHA